MKRSPIINALTDADFEQTTDPSIDRHVASGSTWYNPETGDMWYRTNGDWELIHDDELTVGDLWYNQADRKMYAWDGGSWTPQQLHF